MATPPPSTARRLLFPLASSLLFLFTSLFLHTGRAAAQDSTFVPRDYILLNCGASGQLTDDNNRNWTGDAASKFGPSSPNTLAATAAIQDSSVSKVPYMTARVFTSPFTYSFPVDPGRKFVRLYFYPSSYSNYAAAESRFEVTANPGNFTLLSNFSASQTAQALNFAYISREFSVNVSSGPLNLTFAPSPGVPNAYAFVNGIEIVSMPDLFAGERLNIVGRSTPYMVDQTTALQTMYRLNVGGNAISPVQDVDLYRSWADDSPYIFGAGTGVTYSQDPYVTITYKAVPEYAAPKEVYGTARSMGNNANINLNYNLTWLFSVDPGFVYLVRMHFCEIQYPFTKINQRVFSIYLNNQTARADADVIAFNDKTGIGSPVYEDYIVIVGQAADQQDFWVALHPFQGTKPEYYDAILNGLEIFKLSSYNGNLAGPNPIPPPQPTPDPEKVIIQRGGGSKGKAAVVGAVGGGVAAVVLVCALVFVVCRRWRKVGGKDAGTSDGRSGWLPLSLIGNSHSAGSAKTNTTGSYASSLPSNLCRHFSFAEIKAATNSFDESMNPKRGLLSDHEPQGAVIGED